MFSDHYQPLNVGQIFIFFRHPCRWIAWLCWRVSPGFHLPEVERYPRSNESTGTAGEMLSNGISVEVSLVEPETSFGIPSGNSLLWKIKMAHKKSMVYRS